MTIKTERLLQGLCFGEGPRWHDGALWLSDMHAYEVLRVSADGHAERVVSVETTKRCAKERGHKVADEVALYVTHGTLHVCGFDDIRKQDRARMRQAERQALSSIGIDIDDVDA